MSLSPLLFFHSKTPCLWEDYGVIDLDHVSMHANLLIRTCLGIQIGPQSDQVIKVEASFRITMVIIQARKEKTRAILTLAIPISLGFHLWIQWSGANVCVHAISRFYLLAVFLDSRKSKFFFSLSLVGYKPPNSTSTSRLSSKSLILHVFKEKKSHFE